MPTARTLGKKKNIADNKLPLQHHQWQELVPRDGLLRCRAEKETSTFGTKRNKTKVVGIKRSAFPLS